MSKNIAPARGYYSILQFVPDLERVEGANIGVILFCPEKRFLRVQTSTSNDRVRRFFGQDETTDLDLDRLNTFKAAFEERIKTESETIQTPEQFYQFVKSRANQLILTEPRPIKVFDPEPQLANLFETLVGGRRRRLARLALSTREEMVQGLNDLLTRKGIAEKV